eukprot:TRINITY_DN33573_c0_g1_i1.p1 TRINITY_DN33573_c0_g1~~TRINITY_DN33573_c0_g1_i1.p1  ORF type:complete len:370 (-),score=40.29 TRINITY_DN33573_c0_g1_i1:51-1052(-)
MITSNRSEIDLTGALHTHLDLPEAAVELDKTFNFLNRIHHRPTERLVIQLLAIAQIRSSLPHLKLVTFDGDGTLYPDGDSIENNKDAIVELISLLKRGYFVALVTAAGYPDPNVYEKRLKPLLDGIRLLPKADQKRFAIVGGECAYLLRIRSCDALEMVQRSEWFTEEMNSWNQDQISCLLDESEKALKSEIERLNLSAKVIRKERAVGLFITKTNTIGALSGLHDICDCEEVAISVQNRLKAFYDAHPEMRIPCCAFNGGDSMFIDVGDKGHGIKALSRYFGLKDRSQILHFGDQFTSTGNDVLARREAPTVWVKDPRETVIFLRYLKEIES